MGPQHGWVRLSRTGAFALVCLALAAGAHAASGGGLPPFGVLLLGALPLWFGGYLLTARRLGFAALAAALALAQAGLHVFFHATHAAASLAAPFGSGSPRHAGMHGSAASGFSAPTEHVVGAAQAVSAAAGVSAAPAEASTGLQAGLTPTMLLAHALAIGVCALVLAYGEDLLWRAVRRLCRVPAAPAACIAAPLWRVHVTDAAATGRRIVAVNPDRGPPMCRAY